MVQLQNCGTRNHAHLKRLLLCGAGWLVACFAQPASAQAPAEMTDLSATITAPAFVTRRYLDLPILDLTAPPDAALRQAVQFIREESARGKVYVHCKIG